MREKPTMVHPTLPTKMKLSIQDFVRPASINYIVPNLFLGDRHAAADRNQLRKLKVTHIVNCAKGLPDCFSPLPSSLSSLSSCCCPPPESAELSHSDEEMRDAEEGFDLRDSSSSSSSAALSLAGDEGASGGKTASSTQVAGDQADAWSPVAYHRCELVDSSRSDAAFEEALDHVFAFVDSAMTTGSDGVVLIHCCAGRSRAPAVMMAYLMYRYSWPLEKAHALVCRARPVVCPNRGFLLVLLRLEKRLLGTNSMRLRHNGHHHTLVSLQSRPKTLALW